MTIGKKIQFLRKRKNITQEALAEELNVSRSAIAKWEADNGIPEIGNVKILAKLFSVSIDALVDDSQMIEESPFQQVAEESWQAYSGKLCNIELAGWNDGVFDVHIIGEDNAFYIYQKPARKKIIYGLIGRKYICSIEPTGKIYEMDTCSEKIDRECICGKPVGIELAHKKGFIKGLLDFRSDDYRNVVIQKFTSSEILLRYGQALDIADVCKIETLED